MTLYGNKGEWSEPYVFLKLLGDGNLYAADEFAERLPTLFYPILSILRKDSQGARKYVRDDSVKVVAPDGTVISDVPIAAFANAAEFLLEAIRNSANAAFEVTEIEEFLAQVDVFSLKAKSTDKRDITIVVHDLHTNTTPELGFSIKSNLGNPSTLLNPGFPTNFIFRLTGEPLSAEEIIAINSIETWKKIRDRLVAIGELGRGLRYHGMENACFRLNLQMIDTLMPEICAEMLLLYFSGKGATIRELLQLIVENNPLKFDLSQYHPLYEYKVKLLLTDSALGMTAAVPWTGKYNATGGYIIVKSDGDVLCYHIYNRDEFQTYMFNNTRLDTPSSTRYGFARVYKEDNVDLIKLNLQIRFC